MWSGRTKLGRCLCNLRDAEELDVRVPHNFRFGRNEIAKVEYAVDILEKSVSQEYVNIGSAVYVARSNRADAPIRIVGVVYDEVQRVNRVLSAAITVRNINS